MVLFYLFIQDYADSQDFIKRNFNEICFFGYPNQT